ncbi:uncharacterized protein ACA1_145550 [Acanthamoeba castellanii str. Neff]|uniref:Peptidase C39-like domain-containing protein n=1 Tax=Acanthamoeba castellanii (strain ATCC 30010 / Neff) TaxID=1257118 RepID=L8GDW6_ACACF|nr:uncharacterized protein ACA1_145550 [Acanthamoeba castellanii str. Neff]ELR10913.1 hypothetical protein ACA1_145550 [Acanthamoeba castellanii str. Neff]
MFGEILKTGWLSRKSKKSGGGEADIIRWTSPEHCALLVGYSPTAVFINDPHTGKRERYDRDLFIDRWLHLGTQAITFRAS